MSFDRDFHSVASRLESTIIALEEASLQVREGFKGVGSITEKIDEVGV